MHIYNRHFFRFQSMGCLALISKRARTMHPVKADCMSDPEQHQHAYRSSEKVYWALLCRLRQLQQPSEVRKERLIIWQHAG